MRRLGLLVAAGSLWLFLAAVPALADGGPHQAALNSGTSTLTSDSCAGCHRAHTAKGPMIINAVDEETLCVSCHGTTGAGATTNVQDGVQYAIGTTSVRGTGEAGALRAGGFQNARLSSSGTATAALAPAISRKPYPRVGNTGVAPAVNYTLSGVSFSEQVPALTAGQQVTSAHVHLPGTTDVTGPDVLWGNGAANSGAGPVVTGFGCADCHNVHGNNQYRILKPVPDAIAATGSTFTAVAAPGVTVADVRTAPTGTGDAGTRNYTIKWGATLADVVNNTYPNPDSATGDYWRRLQPFSVTPTWTGASTDNAVNPSGGVMGANYYRGDMPEFIPTGSNQVGTPSGSSTAWRTAMSTWCAACHSRYHTATTAVLPGPAAGLNQTTNSGDSIFTYRHGTTNSECTQCHVSHGSNAAMTGPYASTFTLPNGAASASSRLLKVANRGTCQACHDPTGTIPYSGPVISQ
ncbi:MAG TPA: cytochrome c3 family protein [Propionicimonas sp.]